MITYVISRWCDMHVMSLLILYRMLTLLSKTSQLNLVESSVILEVEVNTRRPRL